MNKKLTLAALGAVALLASCGGEASVKLTQVPVQLEGEKNWSLVGADGKVLYEDEFINKPSAVINGFFSVEENGGVSVYKAGSKIPQVVGDLTGLHSAGQLTEDRIAVVRPNSRIEMCDKDGNTVFTLNPIGGEEVKFVGAYFTEGLVQFELNNDLQGCMDKDGNVVIPAEYYWINDFMDGVAIATKHTDEGTDTYILEPDGSKTRISNSLTLCRSYFYKEISAAYRGDGDDKVFGFINKKGEFAKVTSSINNIREWGKDYFVYTDDEYNDGVMNMRGEVLIRPKYKNIYMIDGDRFVAEKTNGKYAILKSDGTEVEVLDVKDVDVLVSPQYQWISTDFKLTCKEGNEVFLLDKDGKYDSRQGYKEIDMGVKSFVYSQYFDLDNTVRSFIEPLTSSGYGRYTLGSTMSTYMSGSTESHRYERSFDDDEYLTGYKYSVDLNVTSNNTVVYDSTPYQWYYTWSWNPNSKVDRIKAVLDIDQDVTGLDAAVRSALTNKGFTGDGNTFTLGSTKVTVDTTSDRCTLVITRK